MPPAPRSYWRNPKLWQFALAGFWLAMFVATHLPVETPGLPRLGIDKLVHLGTAAVLSVLFATTWELSAGRLTPRHLVWVWLIIATYAVFDEWTQPFVGRDASPLDWLADATGAALGLAAFMALRKRLVVSNP